MSVSGYALASGEGSAVWFLGTTMTVKAGGDSAGGAFTLIEQLCPPEFQTPPHIHETEDEAFYVLQGELAVSCGDERWQVGAGGFVFLPRGIAHGFNVSAGPARLLQLTSPGGFEKFARRVGSVAGAGSAPPPSPEDIERLLSAAPEFGYRILGPEGA